MCLSVGGRAFAENIVFPTDAGVIDITQAPYNAVGDGKSDCTEALQQAFKDAVSGKGNIVYVPNGTFIIKAPIRWQGRQTRNVLQGQSQDGAILKLPDHCAGFIDPSHPRAMVWTGEFPPQRFRNAIRNITLDVGSGNAGAIGAQFNASNQGQMNSVTIRSSDGRGAIGLDMGYTGDVGPLLVKNLKVVGFDVGIYTAFATAAQTLEFVRLENQNVAGWVNDGQAVAMRRLSSVGSVPVIENKAGSGMITLVDADLRGTGEADKVPAIDNRAGLFVRNLKVAGFKTAIDGALGSGRGADGPTVEEFTSHPPLSLFPSPPKSLNLTVRETPDVPWNDLKDWVSVAKFPPKLVTVQQKTVNEKGIEQVVKKTVTDWTDSLQQAIDSGAKTVYFPRSRGTKEPYGIYGTVYVRGNVQRIIGMENGFGFHAGNGVLEVVDGTAPVVVIERFDWIYTAMSIRNNSKRTLVVSAVIGPLVEAVAGSENFLEDIVGTLKIGAGAKVWVRQFNTEYTSEAQHILQYAIVFSPTGKDAIGSLNDGGDLWVLGIKSEGDGTLITTRHGGRTEVLGGLVYSNHNKNPDKRAFVVEDSSFCLSVGEWVSRNQPTNMVGETRGEVARRLVPGTAPGRGGGSLVPLYAGYTGDGAVEPTPPKVKTDVELPVGKGSGLRGDYFSNNDFTSLKTTRTDPQVAFDWSKSPPAEGTTLERGSVRWTGRLEAPVSGSYGFSISPAGTRLMIGGRVVVDGTPGDTRYRDGRLRLEAGRTYDVKMEFRGERGREGNVSLNWQPPGHKGEPVPSTQLYPDGAVVPDVTLAISKKEIVEGETAQITLTRTGDPSAPLTVWMTPRVNIRPTLAIDWDARGNAVAGIDYDPIPESVTFPAGKETVTLPLVVPDNTRPEPDRRIVLQLAFASDYHADGVPTALLKDNDMPPPGDGTGLTGAYFGNQKFEGTPVKTRIDAKVDFSPEQWDKKPPMSGLDPKTGYSIRWTGQIKPLFSEAYRIDLRSTDYGDVSVWIDGKQVITAVGKDGAHNAKVDLQAGHLHDIKIEYVFNNKNAYGSFARLVWSSPSQFEQVIPTTQLFPVAAP